MPVKVEDDFRRRVPPQSLEAEDSLLGAVLLDNTALDRVVELLTPDDFYSDAHRKIYAVMLEMSQRGDPADVVTLAEVLDRKGELAAVGGAARLAELADTVPSAVHAPQYARIVRERAVMRQLIHVCTGIAARCYAGPEDVARFVDEAEQLIFEVSDKQVRPSFCRVGDIVMDTIKTIERLYEKKELITGVPTGFARLDYMTAGFQPSDLIIVASRPSMGKTALCLNVAQYAAVRGGLPVAIFSMEMPKEQLMMRLLCSEARVDGSRVRTGHLAERDFPRLAQAASRLSDAPIFLDDTPAQNVLEVRAKARRLKREADLRLLIVDYLQLMRGVGDEDNRTQEVSDISRGLKALAKELAIPVVAISQLNRQVEGRSDKRPMMADLRESGSIEQDADVVLFIYRDEMYNPNSEHQGVAEILLAKQRNGPTGSVNLAFLKEYTRFENLSEEEPALEAEEA